MKKGVVIILLILFIILVISISYIIISPKPKKEILPPILDCENQSFSSFRDHCYGNYARDTKNKEYLQFIKDGYILKLYQIDFAVLENNISFCRDSSIADYCITKFAIATNNIPLCNSSDCFYELAKLNNNISMCNLTEDTVYDLPNLIPSINNYCYEHFLNQNSSVNECYGQKDSCYYLLAKLNNNFSLCAKNDQFCIDYFKTLKLSIQDIDQITPSITQNCQVLSDSDFKKDICFFKLALKNKNKELCKNVRDIIIIESGCKGQGAGHGGCPISYSKWILNRTVCANEVDNKPLNPEIPEKTGICCDHGKSFYAALTSRE